MNGNLVAMGGCLQEAFMFLLFTKVKCKLYLFYTNNHSKIQQVGAVATITVTNGEVALQEQKSVYLITF